MLRFLATRVVSALSALLALSVVAFLMVRAMPGDMVTTLIGNENVSAETRRLAIERYGLDKSLVIQYWRWFTNVLHGDLGTTVITGQSVTSTLSEKIVPSVQLALIAVVLSIVSAVLLGTLAALRRGGVIDKAMSAVALIGTSLPDFVVGLLLIIASARWFGLPTFGYEPLSEGFGPWISHLILPALALSFGLMGLLTRLTRNAVSETKQQEYVRTARSKGVHGRKYLWRHILRPSLIPIVTTAGLQLVAVIGGIVVIEVVFSIPGMGQLILDGLRHRDYALIQAATLVIGCVAIVVSLFVDLMYKLLDPRVRR